MLNDKMLLERYIKSGNTFIYPDLISRLYNEQQTRISDDNIFEGRADILESFYQNFELNDYKLDNYFLTYNQYLEFLNTTCEPTTDIIGFETYKNQLIKLSLENDLYMYNGDQLIRFKKEQYQNLLEYAKNMLYVYHQDLKIKIYPFRIGNDLFIFIPNNMYSYTYYLNFLTQIMISYIIKYNAIDTLFLKNYTNMESNATLFFNNRNNLESKLDQLQNNPNSIQNFKDLVKMVKDDLDILTKHKASVVNKLETKADLIQTLQHANIYLSEETYSYNELKFYGHVYLNLYFLDDDTFDKDEPLFNKAYNLFIKNKEICLFEFGSYYNNKLYT